MSTGPLDAFDRSGDLVARNPAAVGVLWLTAAPARLLLAALVVQALRLGDDAQFHGDALVELAGWATLAWLVSLWGRQVFVRACRAGIGGATPRGRALWRVPWRELLAALQAAAVLAPLFWATLPLVLLAPPLIALAGVAAVASPLAGPGWVRPVRALSLGNHGWTVALLALTSLLALALAALNLHLLAQGLAWAAGGIAGVDLAPWGPLLTPSHALYAALVIAAATLLVEPFWLAALVVVVHEARARASGEDLRLWIERLQAEDPTPEVAEPAPPAAPVAAGSAS